MKLKRNRPREKGKMRAWYVFGICDENKNIYFQTVPDRTQETYFMIL